MIDSPTHHYSLREERKPQRVDVQAIRTPGLGDTTYILSHNGRAIVVDPQRDVDRFLDAGQWRRDRRARATVCLTWAVSAHPLSLRKRIRARHARQRGQ